MLIPFMEPPEDDIREYAEKLEKVADHLGLYMQGFAVGALPNHDHNPFEDEEPEAHMLLLATFAVGEVAFSDRIMNPEKYDEDGKFREITIDADPLEVSFEELKRHYLGKEKMRDEEEE